MSPLNWIQRAPAFSSIWHHRLVTLGLGQPQRALAVAVGELDIRTRNDQRLKRCLVARPTIAQHDGLDHRRPVEVVHMVQRRSAA